MEHNLQSSAPFHWGYGTGSLPPTPQTHWVQPSSGHGVKRTLSESDCDEIYSEESSKEQISPGETGSCQLMSRKKRRGVIEKKRRDRINSSLSELKRLVPSAYEKQGSAKLEKAEILQLTVEHLKNINAKGVDSFNYDPQRVAMDYHIIGFRECAAEVARYLVTIEGMDIQDPLRLRLMSHLQYFVQQRELAAKNCASPSGWTAASSYPSSCAAAPYQTYASSPSYMQNLSTPLNPYPTISSSPSSTSLLQHQQQQQQQQHPSHHHSRAGSSNSSSAATDSHPIVSHSSPQPQPSQQQQQQQIQQYKPEVQHAPPNTTNHENLHQQQQQQQQHPNTHQQQQHYPQEHTHTDPQGTTYIELTNSQQSSIRNVTSSIPAGSVSYGTSPLYPVSGSQDYMNNTSINYVSTNGSKPYRPWGAEMAY